MCEPNHLHKQRYPVLSSSLFDFCNPPALSVIESDFGGAFEPTPIGAPRSKQQAAASSTILKETLRLLFQDCDRDTTSLATSTSPVVSLTLSEATLSDNLKNEDNIIRPTCFDSPSSQATDATSMYTKKRFRAHHKDKWESQFELLKEFKQNHGHCRIPHTYPECQSLARWVKRQRYQHKQKLMGVKTTMTARRVEALEELGFIWDSHVASWDQRMGDLVEFRDNHGHCHVPTHYQENKQLAIWVKCQRRQYKLLKQGKSSTLTTERLNALNKVGFEWRAKRSGKTITDDN